MTAPSLLDRRHRSEGFAQWSGRAQRQLTPYGETGDGFENTKQLLLTDPGASQYDTSRRILQGC